MKKRILALILTVVLALAGCGSSKPNEELDKITNEIVVGQDSSVIKPTEEPTAAPTVEPENPSAETETPTENESTESTSTEKSEEEKYFLTFEATTTEGEAWNSDRFADSQMT